jgi:hypothetical protein
MNRKLQHTLQALTATAAVFTVLLLAGGPTTPTVPVVTMQLSGDSGAGVIDASEATQPGASQRRHRRHSRELLALPYFSFAQGLRRTRS